MAKKEKKHPKGLMVLFFTEMWERFGFYLMLGIFTLYMIADESSTFPGMGMSKAESADIYGTYLALVYLTPFFGGLIADRFLGYRRSIYIGGLLMAAGYMGLAVPNSMLAFFLSLMLIILGNGMFKPNISVLLGKLYDDEKYIHLKDAGFNIFYMGINIGAFVCNFVAAYLRIKYGWGWAFAAAGIGMLLGVIWLFLGEKKAPRISEADVISKDETGQSMGQIMKVMFLPAVIAGAIGWFIPGNILGADSTDAFLFFSIPIIIYYINLVKSAKQEDKEPIKALLAVMGVVIVFWAVFHQNGSALTFWAKNNTVREMDKTTEKVFSALELTESASTAPRIIERVGLHGEFVGYDEGKNYYFDNFQGELPEGNLPKDDEGNYIVPGDVSKTYSYEQYIVDNRENFDILLEKAKTEPEKEAVKEKREQWEAYLDGWLQRIDIEDETQLAWEKIPDEKKAQWGVMKLWPTELQASINPFYIIILTPVVVGFFKLLRKRNREPSTPAKIGYGLLITSLSMLVMVGAAIVSNSGEFKTSVAWMFGIYGVITIGELFLSPMGLSLVSKLSPKPIAAVMMGGWFLSTAIGNKLSGVLSGFWDLFEKKEFFFLTNVGLTLIAAIGIFILLPWLRRVVKERTGE